VGEGLVVVQDVEREHVHEHLDLVYVRVLARSGGQNLERQQLAGGLVDSHDLTVQNKRFQVVLVPLHALLDVLHQVDVCLGDVLQVS